MINIGGIIASLEIEDKSGSALEKARQALALVEREIMKLDQAYKAGGIGIYAYSRQIQELSNIQADLVAKMRDGFNARNFGDGLERIETQMNKGRNASRQWALGMMQLGYVVDDLQYSFLAAVNNIGPLVIGFGGGVGLAGSLQVAAVAASQMYQNWDALKANFGDTSGFEKAKESIKGLEGEIKSLTYAIDTMGNTSIIPGFDRFVKSGDVEKLREIKDIHSKMSQSQESLDRMKPGTNDLEREAREAFQEAVASGGGADVIARKKGDQDFAAKGFEAFLSAEDKAALRAAKESQARSNARGGSSTVGNEAEMAAREKARLKAEEAARKWLGDSSLSEKGREEVANWLNQNGMRNTGRAIFAGEDAVTLKQDEKNREEADERREKVAKEARDAAEKKAAEEKKASDAAARAKKEEDDRDKQFRRDNLSLAKILVPDLEDLARKSQDAIDRGADRGRVRGGLAKAIQDRGMTEVDADDAAKDLLAAEGAVPLGERNKRREKENRDRMNAREKRADDALQRAEGLIPGLADQAQQRIADVAMMGGNFLQAAAVIKGDLIASGAAANDEEASDMAMKLAKQGRASLAERVRQEAMQPEKSSSQTMSASDLARAAQSGVTGDSVVNKLEKQTELLAEMVRQGQNVLNLRIN